YFFGICRVWVSNDLDLSILIPSNVFCFQFLINLLVAFFLHVNLHDGITGLIKKLEALQDTLVRLLFYCKTKGPGGEEYPLLDRSYHCAHLERRAAVDFDFLEIALVLEYTAFTPCQRHDFA